MSSQVIDNSAESRYELHLDGQSAGFAVYQLTDGAVVFTHTEIDPAVGGKGHGGTLVRGALDDVRGRGLSVVPACPFVKSYIAKHPEYEDLLK
ncbi:MAG: GNAT family N-acetyltransferase [Streptosporangiaceae bacterium]